MPEELNSKEDFEWYKKELDVSRRYDHEHKGEPEKYPCIVMSSFWDDPNGPYTYNHTFIYQETVKCSSCGHVEVKFPNSTALKEILD